MCMLNTEGLTVIDMNRVLLKYMNDRRFGSYGKNK